VARVSSGRAASEKRDYGRSAGLLTVALGVAGVLTYAFFGIASHSLNPDSYGDIVILWSVVFLLASTLFRPVEQLLASTLAEQEQAGSSSHSALRSAALIQSGLFLAVALVLVVAKGPIEEALFAGQDTLYWILIASLLGFGLAYYARGFLAGRGQFRHYAALLVIEVCTRLAFAVAVALGIASGADAVAIGIATAPVAVIIVLPLAIRRGRPHDAAPPPRSSSPTDLTLSKGGAFAGAVLVMMLSEQILINSGALFVRSAEGAAAAGFIFNVMMVARAPLVLFQAVAASLLPHLTRLRARGDRSAREVFRSSVDSTLMLIAGFATLTTVGVVAIGPEVMQIAFGDDFVYDREGLAIVAVGMGLYLAAASLNQAALAQAQAHRAAICWIACAVLFVVINLSGVLNPFRAVEIGFAVSSAVLATLLYLLYRNPMPAPEDEIEPGSPRELQASLTASDEIV
jgi:O-antigen/teichoic acid export membrane protein